MELPCVCEEHLGAFDTDSDIGSSAFHFYNTATGAEELLTACKPTLDGKLWPTPVIGMISGFGSPWGLWPEHFCCVTTVTYSLCPNCSGPIADLVCLFVNTQVFLQDFISNWGGGGGEYHESSFPPLWTFQCCHGATRGWEGGGFYILFSANGPDEAWKV